MLILILKNLNACDTQSTLENGYIGEAIDILGGHWYIGEAIDILGRPLIYWGRPLIYWGGH